MKREEKEKRSTLSSISMFDPSLLANEDNGREVAKGIVAVKDNKKVKPIAPKVIDPLDVLSRVSDPSNGLTEVTLPDGTTLRGAYSPSPVLATPNVQGQVTEQPNPALGQVNPMQSKASTSYNELQPTGTYPAPNPGEGSPTMQAIGQAGEFLMRPDVQEFLGQLASALGTQGKYKTWGAQLGDQIAKDAHAQIYGAYLSELQSGKSPSEVNADPRFAVLTPQERALAAQQLMTQQRIGIEQQRANTYDRLAEAQIKGTLTAEDKKRLEEIKIATQKKIGEMAHRYLRLNQVQYLDVTTGEVFTVPGGDLSKISGSGNINASVSKLLNDQTATLFLDKALENYRASLPPEQQKTYDKLKVLTQVFNYDPANGTIAWEKVFNFLSDKDRAKFARELVRMSSLTQAGYPPSVAFATSPLIPSPPPEGKKGDNQTGKTGEKPKVRSF